jgi:hypothetical protein
MFCAIALRTPFTGVIENGGTTAQSDKQVQTQSTSVDTSSNQSSEDNSENSTIPVNITDIKSFLVTRPSNPLPTTCDKSMSCSEASLNTDTSKSG